MQIIQKIFQQENWETYFMTTFWTFYHIESKHTLHFGRLCQKVL